MLSDYSKPMYAGIKMLGQYKIANILRSLGYNVLVIESYSQIPKKDLFEILEKSISSETLFLGYSSTMYFGPVKNSKYGPPKFFPGGTLGEDLFIDINTFSKRINPNLHVLLGGAGSKGFMGIGSGNTAPTSLVDISGDFGYRQLRLRTSYTPSASTDTNGSIGQIVWDSGFVYVRTSTQWRRASISTW